MQDRLDLLDYYTLLGVDNDAGVPDIKRAFRSFARKYHPDRFAGGPPEKIARANQIYRRGTEAFRVLTDPTSRRVYNESLGRGRLRLSIEERDRALAEEDRQARAKKAAKGITAVRSPQAKVFYRKAVEASKAGDWRGAWKALQTALEHEPDNEYLKSRIAKVEARIRTMG